MIVNLVENGWEVIYHRAHALLAAQIAGQWRRSDSPPRIYETIAAISHHDDLEREWEGDHLTPAGAPLDFNLGHQSGDSAIGALRKHLTEARYRGRWVTMLTSMHITFLSQGERGQSPAWDEFLDEQLQNQKKWREALGVSEEDADRAYQFMQWCDRLSLILAQRDIPVDNRALEITDRLDGQRYDVRQLSDGCLTVEPWPFQDDRFTLNVEALHLTELKYDSNEALVKAMQEAPVEIIEWTFVKSPVEANVHAPLETATA